MSSSSHKNDDGMWPLYCQGGSLSKVGYFKAAHFKISSDNWFRDFLEAYCHAIPSRMRVKRAKDGSSREPCDEARRAIKFHPYYFALGFTFPMPRFFQEVLCSMRYSEFGSTPKTSPDMKKVHFAIGIPSEYCEWRWMLSHLRREKGGMPPREEIKRIKSEKVPLPAKVAPKLIPSAVKTDSFTEKKETARAGNHEKSTKSAFREVAEICVLLKPDLLKDIDVCAKFVDGVKGVVGPSSFVKHMTRYKRIVLLAMMQKTMILEAESMLLDQEDTKAAKKLETACQEIVDLKTMLDAIQVKTDRCYNQVIYFKKVVDRLEPQGALKINDNLKKEVEELQRAGAAGGEELDGAATEGVMTAEVPVELLKSSGLDIVGGHTCDGSGGCGGGGGHGETMAVVSVVAIVRQWRMVVAMVARVMAVEDMVVAAMVVGGGGVKYGGGGNGDDEKVENVVLVVVM
ncbi:hypothetical protein D8674_012101 [Pyrus ussuriensis x Pyrus communis]|uniref:Uncharacterized protein n=1 Tax=Pyrus ussuriensis x Pyrus communis TaxID=2448454 RepID=A0A5N5G0Q3_9ROSA|nr:hypothetical protein D8674_012101 [Pyrus ussuriensis x Pyrus communis]